MKYIKYWVLTIGLLVASLTASAQILLEGTILKQGGGEAIPFATVGIPAENLGTITNLNGTFSLTIPKEFMGEALVVSTLGFETKSLPIKDLSSSTEVKIYLKEKVTELSEVEITADRSQRIRAKQTTVGNRYFNTGTMRLDANQNGGAMALLITHDQAPFVLSTAKLRIRSNTLPTFKVRVRAFSVNQSTGAPGKDLFEKSIVLESDVSRGWLKFELDQYNLWVDEPEFYLVFEWVLDQQDRNVLSNQLKNHLVADPTLLSASTIAIGDTEVQERTIKDFDAGVWFGTVIDPTFNQRYKSYYRLNSYDEWKPSAAILTSEVTLTNFN